MPRLIGPSARTSAANMALPHPPNTRTNVPSASALSRDANDLCMINLLLLRISTLNALMCAGRGVVYLRGGG